MTEITPGVIYNTSATKRPLIRLRKYFDTVNKLCFICLNVQIIYQVGQRLLQLITFNTAELGQLVE